jgi:hypothetical protein
MTNRLLAMFEKTQLYRDLVKQEAESVAAKRKAAVAAIEKLNADEAASRPGVLARCDAANKALEGAKEAYAKAKQAAWKARQERVSSSVQCDHARSVHERYLRESADPRIAEFMAECSKAIQRVSGDFTHGITTYEDFAIQGRVLTHDSVVPHINEVMAAYRVARAKAESLIMIVCDDVAAELEKIRAEIPAYQPGHVTRTTMKASERVEWVRPAKHARQVNAKE